MMYELAKELKDAGFPQNTEFYHEESEYEDNRRYHRPHSLYGIRLGEFPTEEQSLIADPSLEELIYQCKDLLPKNPNNVGEVSFCRSLIDGKELWCFGNFGWEEDLKTAVAQFWLANKKKNEQNTPRTP